MTDSDSYVIRVQSTATPEPGTCHTCGFDALMRIRLYQISDTSVGQIAEAVTCSRCALEGDDD